MMMKYLVNTIDVAFRRMFDVKKSLFVVRVCCLFNFQLLGGDFCVVA
jgi:hypothetical protein